MGSGMDKVVVLPTALAHNVGEPGVVGQVVPHRLPQPLECPAFNHKCTTRDAAVVCGPDPILIPFNPKNTGGYI